MEAKIDGTQNSLGYNPSELLICSAARLMSDFTTAIIGTGIPMLAAALAQRMQAPNLVAIFEFGGIGAANSLSIAR
jgi:glutaconate CoA-transferase subunit B